MNELTKEFEVTLAMLLYSNDMALANRLQKECRELIKEMKNFIETEFDETSISASERLLNRTYELVKNYNESNNN
jgi:hypothetical protein